MNKVAPCTRRVDPYSGNIHDPQSLHKYLYCHNNPVNGIDPSGNMFSLSGVLTVQSITAVAIASLAPAIMAAYDSAKAGLSWYEIGKNAALAWAISFGIGVGIMMLAPYVLAAATWLLTLIPGVSAVGAQIAILLAFVGLSVWGLKSVWSSDYPLSIKISVTLIFAMSVVVSLGKDGIKQLASGAKNVLSKLNGSPKKGPAPRTGTKVWRVYGEKNNPMGESWTDIDPSTVNNYRNSAGLPDSNTGRFIVEGKIIDNTDVWTRSALALDGNTGGLSEVLIPDAASKVQVTNVSGVNPPF